MPVGNVVVITYLEPRTAFGGKAQAVVSHAALAAVAAYKHAAAG